MEKVVLEELLSSSLRMGASSLHLIPGQRPAIRVQRRFVMSEHPPVRSAEIEELARDFLFEDHRRRLHERGQVEVLYVSGSGCRFRTTVMRQSDGVSVLMRPVPAQPPRLNDLELPPHVGSFTQYRSGLIVVAGFFGAGKSTTLAALVDKINHESVRHVVTLEDPIEFLHPTGSALLHQREIGVHVGSFPEGIRQAVRLGANVIMAGEMRDGESLEVALDAVESGCLVLTSVPASSVVAACTELPALLHLEHRARIRTRLATALRVVLAQTLLQRPQQKGRVPLVEILINNLAVRSAIRTGNFQELPGVMHRCRGLGMQTAELALRGLVSRQLVGHDEARHYMLERDQTLQRVAQGPAAGSTASTPAAGTTKS